MVCRVGVVSMSWGNHRWGGLPGLTWPDRLCNVTHTNTHSAATIILLDIYSEHCPACHLLRPTLAQAAQHFKCVVSSPLI